MILEPVAKAINPVITWQFLFFHSEAMTTLSIEVQFNRVTGISPRGIERQTCSRTHRVIVGGQQKQLSYSLNKRGLRSPQPVKWTVRFGERHVYTISFDGEQWDVSPTDVPDAEVRIVTTPQTWVAFVSSPKEERHRLLSAMRISGEQSCVDELLAITWIEKQP
jgi:hypothetical protein